MRRTGGTFLRDTRDAVLALRLLVLAGLAMLGIAKSPTSPIAFWIATIVYAGTNLAYMASGAAALASVRVHTAIFAVDVLVVSCLIVLRGVEVPELILAYFTLVLMAAVVQGVGTALLNALVVCTVFAAVSLWGADTSRLLSFPVLAQFAFFFVVSVFMSQLAEAGRDQARRHARVEEERHRLAAEVEDRTRDLSRSEGELEDARTRLAAADRLAAIGAVAAGVAHDIRNPVAALKAALEEAPTLLAELAGPSGDAGPCDARGLLQSALDDAREACDHLHRLATDLTAMARTTPAVPVEVPVSRALEAAERLLRHRVRPPVSMVVRCTTSASVLADPGRLQQLLQNLGANALDAMEARGGVLTLAAEDGPDGTVRLQVEDTGIGMTDSVAARAFEGFFTTKAADKGTGLGLHLVREIARTHGARIELDSKPGVGTKVRIDWPAAPRAVVPGGSHERIANRTADRGRRGEHPQGARADATA